MALPPRDPEIEALLATTRLLTGKAHKLSRSINAAIEELEEFVQNARGLDLIPERRRSQQPYEGNDRRGD